MGGWAAGAPAAEGEGCVERTKTKVRIREPEYIRKSPFVSKGDEPLPTHAPLMHVFLARGLLLFVSPAPPPPSPPPPTTRATPCSSQHFSNATPGWHLLPAECVRDGSRRRRWCRWRRARR